MSTFTVWTSVLGFVDCSSLRMASKLASWKSPMEMALAFAAADMRHVARPIPEASPETAKTFEAREDMT